MSRFLQIWWEMVFTSLLCNKIKIQKEQRGRAKENEKEDKDEEWNEKKEEAKKSSQ